MTTSRSSSQDRATQRENGLAGALGGAAVGAVVAMGLPYAGAMAPLVFQPAGRRVGAGCGMLYGYLRQHRQ
jgi:hypothetical protein